MSIDINALKEGDILQHKLSKDWVMVLEIKVNINPDIVKIYCRTKSLDIKDFYDFELEPKP